MVGHVMSVISFGVYFTLAYTHPVGNVEGIETLTGQVGKPEYWLNPVQTLGHTRDPVSITLNQKIRSALESGTSKLSSLSRGVRVRRSSPRNIKRELFSVWIGGSALCPNTVDGRCKNSAAVTSLMLESQFNGRLSCVELIKTYQGKTESVACVLSSKFSTAKDANNERKLGAVN